MAHIFEITSPEKGIALDTNGAGRVSFTVTNVGMAPAKVRAVLGPPGGPALAWLKLAGEAERVIQPKLSDVFVVNVNVPAGTSAGDYKFRLDAISVERIDEDSTEGPSVSIPVTLAPQPPKKFPWWLLAAAAVVIAIASFAAIKLIPDGRIEVPDLTDASLFDGSASLVGANLQLGKIDSVLREIAKVDKIVSQDPLPKARVAPGSKVNVQIGVALVKIPDLRGPLEAAQKTLENLRLNVGTITHKNVTGAAVGTVIESDPPQGFEKQTHSKVNLVVQPGKIPVPDLTGQTLDGIRTLLVANNLTVGSIAGNAVEIRFQETEVGGPFGMAGVKVRLPRGSAPNTVVDWSPRNQDVDVGSVINLTFPGTGNGSIDPRVLMDIANTRSVFK